MAIDSNIKTVRQYPVESGFGDTITGELAQMARAPALQAGGRGFDSHILHHGLLV